MNHSEVQNIDQYSFGKGEMNKKKKNHIYKRTDKTNLPSRLKTNNNTETILQCLLSFLYYGRNFHTHTVRQSQN